MFLRKAINEEAEYRSGIRINGNGLAQRYIRRGLLETQAG
jgi:hypothetical protein